MIWSVVLLLHDIDDHILVLGSQYCERVLLDIPTGTSH